MLGPNTGAMACRLPDGTIDLETWNERNGKNAPWYRKVPLIRGCTSFVTSLSKGYKYMMKSAEKQLTEEEKAEEENASAIFSAMMYAGMIIGIVMAIGLFVFLPKWIVGFFPAVKEKRILRSFIEGIVKIAIFVG